MEKSVPTENWPVSCYEQIPCQNVFGTFLAMSKFRANAAAQHGRPTNPLKALGALGPIKPSLELVDASSSNEINELADSASSSNEINDVGERQTA